MEQFGHISSNINKSFIFTYFRKM
uniref:Uncharacterized protein n=1 Tax=Lepeophtheirus salmonis TaxID=72036 RepID=A0A0K2T233_LEPSM